MTDWTAEQLSIYEDIKAEGFEVSLLKPDIPTGSPGGFDPNIMDWVGVRTPVQHVDYQTYAIRKEYSLKEVDGTIIQRNDSMLVIPAYGLPDDLINVGTIYKVLIGSVEQSVIHIGPVSPGDVPLLYNIQVRK